MSRPPSNSASASASSASSSHPHPAALSDDDIDRRLQQRLAKLQAQMHPSAIQVSLPPPSAEQLEARLKRLEAADSKHSDEAELQRRFDRLSGTAAAARGTNGSASSTSSPPSHSFSDIALAGHSSTRPSHSDEVEQLLDQTRQQLQLANGTGATSNAACSASSSSASAVSAAGASSSDADTAPGSPPPPSSAEVAQLMRQLSSLPDAEMLPPVHGVGSEDEDSAGSDAEVDEIVRQAMDEAKLT